MKNIIVDITWIAFGALLVALLLHTKVTFKPFSIQFENWRFVLGLIIIFAGVELMCYDAVQKYKENVIKNIEGTYEGNSDTISDR